MTKLKTDENLVVYLTGEAPKITPEKTVSLSGALCAPRQYLENKVGAECQECQVERPEMDGNEIYIEEKVMYNYKHAYLLVQNEEKRIVLQLNTKNNTTDTVEGSLLRHKIWNDLRVNTDNGWTIADLRKAVKRMKFFFANAKEHEAFLEHLFDFDAKIETTH